MDFGEVVVVVALVVVALVAVVVLAVVVGVPPDPKLKTQL